MIVDDEESIQFLFKEGLSLKGHEVIGAAYNGEEALDLLIKTGIKPDIIILDHRMPIKNGIETLKEIKENNIAPQAKIFFISADMSVKALVEKIGVSEFINKPFSLIYLLKKIEGTS